VQKDAFGRQVDYDERCARPSSLGCHSILGTTRLLPAALDDRSSRNNGHPAENPESGRLL